MKYVTGFLLLTIFCFQIGVKSMVAGYFGLIDNKKAYDNCQYKNITVCKGSCYVVKQIKIFTSEAPSKKRSIPQFDLNCVKDVITDQEKFLCLVKFPLENLIRFGESERLYSFQFSSTLIKPPSA